MENLVQLLDVRVLLFVSSTIMMIILIILFILWNKLNKLRKTYMSMLNGNITFNIEDAIIELQQNHAAMKLETEKAQQQLTSIVGKMRKMKSNLSVYRYNAFAESGSDLSFSIALLDDDQDGVVISGIHNRDETYVYAKPLLQGKSAYTLSPEEKEAIHRSVQKN